MDGERGVVGAGINKKFFFKILNLSEILRLNVLQFVGDKAVTFVSALLVAGKAFEGVNLAGGLILHFKDHRKISATHHGVAVRPQNRSERSHRGEIIFGRLLRQLDCLGILSNRRIYHSLVNDCTNA